MSDKIIFHIDVNSAYLSWEAVYRLQHGEKIDLREIPSVVGGNEKSRHGIILAKSIPAKKYGITTGESLMEARQKCPNLKIVPPHYELYMQCSGAMIEILKEYSPKVQVFSIDECFMEYSGMEKLFGNPIEVANTIRERIKKELGFTVNIGISTNKLLAKMGGELKKPDKVCTLFPNEIKEKLWTLPVEDLYMVGRRTTPKLKNIGINTIGDLANCDINLLRTMLKSHGVMLWNYAHGIENSDVRDGSAVAAKGIGNSMTIPFDVDDRVTALKILLSLIETASMRLRQSGNCASVICIHFKTNEFISFSHQAKIPVATDSTIKIYEIATKLFDDLWKGQIIRQIGVRVTDFHNNDYIQMSIFDSDNEKRRKLDATIDNLRVKHGMKSVFRSCFLYSGLKPVTGGVMEEDYQLMTSIL